MRRPLHRLLPALLLCACGSRTPAPAAPDAGGPRAAATPAPLTKHAVAREGLTFRGEVLAAAAPQLDPGAAGEGASLRLPVGGDAPPVTCTFHAPGIDAGAVAFAHVEPLRARVTLTSLKPVEALAVAGAPALYVEAAWRDAAGATGTYRLMVHAHPALPKVCVQDVREEEAPGKGAQAAAPAQAAGADAQAARAEAPAQPAGADAQAARAEAPAQGADAGLAAAVPHPGPEPTHTPSPAALAARERFVTVTRAAAEGLQPTAPPARTPRYTEVQVTRLNGHPVGFHYGVVFDRAGGGDVVEKQSTTVLPRSETHAQFDDSEGLEETDARGRVLRRQLAMRSNGELELEMRVELEPDGRYAYAGSLSGKPLKGRVRPRTRQGLLGELAMARQVKERLLTGKAKALTFEAYAPDGDPTRTEDVTFLRAPGDDPHDVLLRAGPMQVQLRLDARGTQQKATVPIGSAQLVDERVAEAGDL